MGCKAAAGKCNLQNDSTSHNVYFATLYLEADVTLDNPCNRGPSTIYTYMRLF